MTFIPLAGRLTQPCPLYALQNPPTPPHQGKVYLSPGPPPRSCPACALTFTESGITRILKVGFDGCEDPENELVGPRSMPPCLASPNQQDTEMIVMYFSCLNERHEHSWPPLYEPRWHLQNTVLDLGELFMLDYVEVTSRLLNPQALLVGNRWVYSEFRKATARNSQPVHVPSSAEHRLTPSTNWFSHDQVAL